jgi:hypothetical protein
MLKPNEGFFDRAIRMIIGVILLGLALYVFVGLVKIILVVVGILLLVTGLLGYCGMYKIFGITTMDKK